MSHSQTSCREGFNGKRRNGFARLDAGIQDSHTLVFKQNFMMFWRTEQGVAMLSSVLNSERAIEVNIAIRRGR